MLLGFRSQNAYGGPTLIIVSNETSISLLHGVFFFTRWICYILVIPGHCCCGVRGIGVSPFAWFKSKNTLRCTTAWLVWLLFSSYQKTLGADSQPILKIGFKFFSCYLAYFYLDIYSKEFVKQQNSASAHGYFWQPHSDEKAVSDIPYKLHSKGKYNAQFLIALTANLHFDLLKTELREFGFWYYFKLHMKVNSICSTGFK